MGHELKQVVDGIAHAHAERRLFGQRLGQACGEMQQQTAVMMRGFAGDRRKMARALRRELGSFKTGVIASEKQRRSETRKALGHRQDEITRIKAEVCNVRKDLRTFLSETQTEQRRSGDAMRALLAESRSQRTASENDRKTSVGLFLSALREENRELADAWRGLIATMATPHAAKAKGQAAKAETKRESAPAAKQEAKSEQPDYAVRGEFDMETLKGQIVRALKESSDGLKMIQVADSLHIDQWRTLIPVMRDMQDNGEIRKEGPFYFSA
jgi:hypothetical protein